MSEFTVGSDTVTEQSENPSQFPTG